MDSRYTALLRQQRPVHSFDAFSFRHPAMPRASRAKIFAPFAALKGFEEAIEAREVVRVPRRYMSEEEQEVLSLRMQALFALCPDSRAVREHNVTVTVCCFRPDAASAEPDAEMGEYRTLTGPLQRLDPEHRSMTVGGARIPFADIMELSFDRE